MTVKLNVGYVGKTRDGKRVDIVKYERDSLYLGSDATYYHANGYGYGCRPPIIGPWVDEPAVGQWVGWNGGPCPVHPDTVVECLFSDGSGLGGHMVASYYCWDSVIAPIIAYRVIREHKEPPKPREFWITPSLNVCDKKPEWTDNAIHVREVLDT